MKNHEKAKANCLVDQLYDAAFNRPRDPRSLPYKQGVRAVFLYRTQLNNSVGALHVYPVGSAESDAFFAGVNEGHRRWNEYRTTGEIPA